MKNALIFSVQETESVRWLLTRSFGGFNNTSLATHSVFIEVTSEEVSHKLCQSNRCTFALGFFLFLFWHDGIDFNPPHEGETCRWGRVIQALNWWLGNEHVFPLFNCDMTNEASERYEVTTKTQLLAKQGFSSSCPHNGSDFFAREQDRSTADQEVEKRKTSVVTVLSPASSSTTPRNFLQSNTQNVDKEINSSSVRRFPTLITEDTHRTCCTLLTPSPSSDLSSSREIELRGSGSWWSSVLISCFFGPCSSLHLVPAFLSLPVVKLMPSKSQKTKVTSGKNETISSFHTRKKWCSPERFSSFLRLSNLKECVWGWTQYPVLWQEGKLELTPTWETDNSCRLWGWCRLALGRTSFCEAA